MKATTGNRYLLVAAALVAAVGVVQAGRAQDWDTLALFGMVGGLVALLLLRSEGRRPPLTLRSDLFRWLQHRATTQGQTLNAAADQAISSHKARVEPSRLH